MKILTRTALCTMAAGAVIFFAGYAASGFDIKKLSDTQYEYTDESYCFSAYINVDAEISYDDIEVKPSEDENVHVSFQSGGDTEYDVSEIDGTVYVTNKHKQQKGLIRIDLNFNFARKKPLTISLPEGYGGYLTLETDCGDVNADGVTAKSFNGVAKYGDIVVSGCSFDEKFFLTADCGDVTLKNTAVNLSTVVTASYGDFTAYSCTLGKLILNAACGDTDILNSDAKDAEINSEYGDIVLTNTSFAGECKVWDSCGDIVLSGVTFLSDSSFYAEYGDITGSINGLQSDYSILADVRYGDKNISNNIQDGKPTLSFETDTGDIKIRDTSN
jgi:DUF4097 and DUF4098 domain-containing protein YvlB